HGVHRHGCDQVLRRNMQDPHSRTRGQFGALRNKTMSNSNNPSDFTDAERETFYRLIAARRDIRRFRSDPVPDEVLSRILWAAHNAGSVGFMQPWNFIVI